MKRYFFDLESNGLLDTMDRIHSLVLKNLDTGEIISGVAPPYCHHYHSPNGARIVDINEAVDELALGDEIIGHNIIKFDIPALQLIYPWFKPRNKVTDTLVLSRLMYGNLADRDFDRIKKQAAQFSGVQYPSKLIGSHGLKAWGYRLGFYKGDFGQDTDWQLWSPEMQSYCEQDVLVTEKLYFHFAKLGLPEQAVKIEHDFCEIIAKQERHGFAFDSTKAVDLYQRLVKRRLELSQELQTAFPPKRVEEVFIPKVNNKSRGYVKGEPFTKVSYVDFNPSSRQMIGDRLMAMGWEPEEFTTSGQAKIDETILQKLPYPEAALLAEHFLVEKRIGQLAEGEQAWLKLARQGRIHGSVNTNGAVTGRCTHSNPNVAQVPSVGAAYGAECRELFTVRHGYSLVGADLSGLELRCLAHFMARYDGGRYGEIVINGDIHTENQHAAGLPTRNNAKTFIYAFLYGAGPVKIGSIVAPQASEEEQRKIGIRLRKAFLKKLPALKKLIDAVEIAADRGYLLGLDGRKLHVRSKHAALNVLLQSAGALIAKVATIIAYEDLIAAGLVWGKDFAQVAHVHDEMQFEVRKGLEETVGKIVTDAMRKAGEHFNFRCPIAGEWKSGSNWKETH